MACTAENNHQPACPAFLVHDAVYLLHKGAGRIEHTAGFALEFFVNRARHAVGTDQHRCPLRDLLQCVRRAHTTALQPSDLMHIVNDLTESVDRPLLSGLLFRQIDCTAHAKAEPGGIRYCNAHTCSFRA